MGCQTVPIFSDIKTSARNLFNLVMSEFQYEFYSSEPLTEAGEEANARKISDED